MHFKAGLNLADYVFVANIFSIENYVIAAKYQLLIVTFEVIPGHIITTLILGNSSNWSTGFIDRAQHDGALISSYHFNTTSKFEEYAHSSPALSEYVYNWEEIAKRM